MIQPVLTSNTDVSNAGFPFTRQRVVPTFRNSHDTGRSCGFLPHFSMRNKICSTIKKTNCTNASHLAAFINLDNFIGVASRRQDMVRNTSLWTGIVLVGFGSPASAAETISYQYDARGRLVEVKRAGTVNNNVKVNYTHDKANNRKTVVTTGSPNSPPP